MLWFRAAAATLAEALALWRGQPLADFAYEAFAQGEIARLEELRLAALEQRIEAELALGSADPEARNGFRNRPQLAICREFSSSSPVNSPARDARCCASNKYPLGMRKA